MGKSALEGPIGGRDPAHPAPERSTSQLRAPTLPRNRRSTFSWEPVYLVLFFLNHHLLRCSVKFIKEAKYFLIVCLYSLTFKCFTFEQQDGTERHKNKQQINPIKSKTQIKTNKNTCQISTEEQRPLTEAMLRLR